VLRTLGVNAWAKGYRETGMTGKLKSRRAVHSLAVRAAQPVGFL